MAGEQRRLSAILFTDIVGYTSLMGEDEHNALEILQINKVIHKKHYKNFNCSYYKQIGDGYLAVFGSVMDAFYAACSIMDESKKKGYQLRMGLHEGEVVFRDDDVFGDEVNIASRIEQHARPGHICISENVKRNIDNIPEITITSVGSSRLKNVKESLNLYEAIAPGVLIQNYLTGRKKDMISDRRKKIAFPVLAFILIVIAAITLYSLDQQYSLFFNSSEKNVRDNISMAILPLINRSNNPEFNYLGEGIADDMLTSLSKIPNLTIISRSSSFRYKPEETTYSRIGRELNVDKLIEGSFILLNDNLRINIKMMDTESGRVELAENFNGSLKDFFNLQDQVSIQISKKLQLSFPLTDSRPGSGKQVDMNAYKYYQLGKGLLKQDYLYRSTIEESREYFREAIKIDGTWDVPLIGMAESYLWEVIFGYQSMSHQRDSINRYTNKAEKINAINGELLAIKGMSALFQYDWERAESFLEKSIRYNPNLPMAYYGLSFLKVFGKNHSKSIEYLDKAILLDPLNGFFKNMKTLLLMFSGHMAEADSAINLLLDKEPGNITTLFMKGTLENLKGNYQAAIRALESRSIGMTTSFMLAYAYARSGQTEKAEIILDNLLEKAEKEYVPYTQIAIVYMGLNKLDDAFILLEKGIEVKDNWGWWFLSDFFAPVNTDPRYINLMKRMNLDKLYEM